MGIPCPPHPSRLVGLASWKRVEVTGGSCQQGKPAMRRSDAVSSGVLIPIKPVIPVPQVCFWWDTNTHTHTLALDIPMAFTCGFDVPVTIPSGRVVRPSLQGIIEELRNVLRNCLRWRPNSGAWCRFPIIVIEQFLSVDVWQLISLFLGFLVCAHLSV